MAKDVTLLIKLQDAASGKVRAIASASKKAEIQVRKLERAVKRTGIQLERMRRKGVEGFKAIAAKAKNAAKSFGGFGKAAAIAAAAAGALAGLRFAFTQAGELEKATRSLKVLTGSLDNAKRIIGELQAFGAVTPFTSAELIETAKRLKAFGFETEKIVDVTKRLADVAGATGADLGGIATAFGQIQAKGRLQGEELLQLQERGINLQGELQEMYGLTGDEFRKALEKGRFSSEAVNLALVKLTSAGGKYAEGAIAQSDTLFGKLSTLQDALQRFGQNIGTFLAPIFKGIIDFLTTITNQINNLFGQMARNSAIDKQARKNLGLPVNGGGRLEGQDRAKLRLERERLREAGFGLDQLNAPQAPDMTVPELLGGAKGAGQNRVDVSKELLALNKQLFESTKPLSELEKINLEYQIEKQEILDRNLLPREEEIALLEAAAGFEGDLLGYRKDQFELQQKAADLAEKERKRQEEAEKRRLENDPGFKMQKQLEELLKVQNQVAAGATAIGNAFSNSFKAVITGSKSAEEALADMMASVAEHFLDMAAQIIAQQLAMILYGTIMKALGVGLPSMGSGEAQVGQMADMGSIGMGGTGIVENKMGQGFGTFGPNFGIRQYAEGGYASGPTRALVGEGGEGEYLIPESKMRESMARYSRGARGSSVIPDSGVSGTSVEGGGTAVAAPIDVRYTVERINSVDYVTADQFQRGMQQAAAQGATQGEQRALTTLRQNTSQRKRIGL